jgi:NAD(P)H-dependent flavin oxidoreductase YrpB (nitropropane dioxygenase family)
MPRPVLKTPLCDLLDIEYPVILAGMGGGDGFSRAELVAAVSEAGGIGVIGGAGFTPDEIHEECEKVRSWTKKPFGVDILLPAGAQSFPGSSDGGSAESGNPLDRLAPEYKAWAEGAVQRLGLQEPEPAPETAHSREAARYTAQQRQDRQVEAIIQEKVKLLAAGLGSPAPYVERLHAAGIVVLGIVGNVRQAVRVKLGGADIVVAQGHEAGGHTGRVGGLALTPQVVDAIAPTPVVAAGGIGDGRGLAAALALGAQGVWVGTAFLATNEANVTPENKQRFIDITEEDTRVTRLFSGKTLRHPVTPLVEDWEASGLKALPMGVQGVLSNHVQLAAKRSGRGDLIYQPAGQIVGMVKEIRPAAEVLEDMVRGAADVITGLQRQQIRVEV